jgi:hypothetical protein
VEKRLESGSRSITPARAGETGETYELPRVCAMFDKPYLARYTRGADGLFRFVETVKVESGTGAGKGSAAQKAVTLKFSEISKDSPSSRCPWCGAKGGVVICYACNAWVCRSKTTKRDGEDYFRCRASCGNETTLDTTDAGFDGKRRAGAAAPAEQKPALPGSEKRPAIPEVNRLRLKS